MLAEDHMRQVTMTVGGMSCAGCVSSVHAALRALPGVRVDAVTVGSATVSYDESRTNKAAIAHALQDAGYEPLAARAVTTGGGCCGGHSGRCGG